MIAEHVTCQMLVELVTEWMDGALAPETRVELELHMVTCAACTTYVDQLRKTRAALGQLHDEAPPEPAVRQNLLSLFRQKTAGAPGEGPGDDAPGDAGAAADDGGSGATDGDGA